MIILKFLFNFYTTVFVLGIQYLPMFLKALDWLVKNGLVSFVFSYIFALKCVINMQVKFTLIV